MLGDIKAWSRSPGAQRLGLYFVFVAYSLFRYWHAPGNDLSSSYFACRLLANGDGGHIYDFHPTLFNVVDTPAWITAASNAHFTGLLHPYVQTPLWAWGLQPLCTNLSFGAFSTVFLCAALLSLAVTIEIVARTWADKFLQPKVLAILLLAVVVSTPFQYAMWLVQTHALFLMAAVLALYLAERDRPIWAGALLAVACAVKITPGLLLIHWLIGGRRHAALWFIVCSLALAVLTPAAVGIGLTLDYVQSMRRVSNVLLVSFNNQSLAAWLGYSQSISSEIGRWFMLPLTPALKAVCMVASIASVVFSGWMSRRHERAGAAAAFALIGITLFSPIAWTHYFLCVIPAVMVLTNAGGMWPLAIALVTVVLNSVPVAVDPIAPALLSVTVVRSHFISAVILLAALAVRWPVGGVRERQTLEAGSGQHQFSGQ